MTWSMLSPDHPDGWEGFSESKAVYALLWSYLPTWQYLNFTTTSSMWEDRDFSGASLYAEYVDERIIELGVDLGRDRGPAADTLNALLSELERTFGIRVSPGDDEPDVVP
jgi:hypothetical protein